MCLGKNNTFTEGPKIVSWARKLNCQQFFAYKYPLLINSDVFLKPYNQSMKEELYNKKSLVALLISLAKADNIIDQAEIEFINDVGHKIGLSGEDIESVWGNELDFPMNVPASERHRITILYQLINLMKSDGEVSPEEENFVRHSGKLLHLNEILIEEFIILAKRNDTRTLSPDVFMENFKKYLN